MNKKNGWILLTVLLIGLVYLSFSFSVTGDVFGKTKFAYYNLLTESFVKGRLNVITEFNYDLSLYNGKLYLYWGPAPALFVFPFYLNRRFGTSDIFYTLVAGFLNVLIFSLVVKEFSSYFKLKLSNRNQLVAILSFAFASPNFYLSLSGRIWHTNQVVAIFYLLLFFLFFFKFLNRDDQFVYLVLSFLFFNLAWLSRMTLIVNGLLFLYLLKTHYFRKLRQIVKKELIVLGILNLFFLIFFIGYNYFRFGKPLDSGWQYGLASRRFKTNYQTGQAFSLMNIPHNFSYYFLNHLPIFLEAPFVRISPEGNSVFSVYPILFFLFFFLNKKFWQNRKTKTFLFVSFSIVILNLFLLMMFFGTGWVQFGNRYFFDVVPLVFLLILLVIKDIPAFIQYLVLFYGSIVNFLGTLVFYKIKI